MKIHVAIVENVQDDNTEAYASKTRKGLYQQLACHAYDHWHEAFLKDEKAPADTTLRTLADLEKMVDDYFDHSETEELMVSTATLE